MASHDDINLRDLLISSVYGPDLEPKSNADVLELIHTLESGVARDHALNGNVSTESLVDLIKKEGEEQFSSPEYAHFVQRVRQLAILGNDLDSIKQSVSNEGLSKYCPHNLRDVLRVRFSDVYQCLTRPLAPCYPIIYIDIDWVRILTKATLTVEHPFYIMLGFDTKGNRELLRFAQYPRNFEEANAEQEMWVEALEDIKHRGCISPVYMVTGAVKGFQQALRQVFPLAIYQHSIIDIQDVCCKSMNTAQRYSFINEFRSLYNARSLLEAMKALEHLKEKWIKTHPQAIQHIKDNFIFFEQYYAANASVRPSIRSTKPVGLIFNDMRRDLRQDENYTYCDSLNVLKRIVEMERFVTRHIKPVQWKRAMQSLLEDRYICKLVEEYINPEDIKLSRRDSKQRYNARTTTNYDKSI